MKRSLRQLLTSTSLACLSLMAAPLAQASALGLSSGLDLLSFGYFDVPFASDVQGQVAVAGDAVINGYSVNTITGTYATYGGTGLTVGGSLAFSNGAIWGNTVVGGNLSTGPGATFVGNVQVAGDLNFNNGWVTGATNNWTTPTTITYGGTAYGTDKQQPGTINPSPTQSSSPVQLGINFAAEQQRLTSLSQSFDALANTGVGGVPLNGGDFTFNTRGADLAVFDISSADVNGVNMSLQNLGANTSVILNVHGSVVNFSALGYQNFNPGHVLFNFVDATYITFSGGVTASILAPLANFVSSGGVINGQVVVANWTGSSSGSAQVNDAPFISAVPEPETYAMLLAGLGLIGFTARRRRPTATQV